MKKQMRTTWLILLALTMAVVGTGVGSVSAETTHQSATVTQTEQDAAELPGVLVARVVPDSPAAAAGIPEGARIQRVNGTAVNTPAELIDAIAELGPGARATLIFVSDGKTSLKVVTLADTMPYLGVALRGTAAPDSGRVTPPARPDRPLPPTTEDGAPFVHPLLGDGLLVVEVVEGSAADAAGIAVGDTIVALDGNAVTTYDALIDALADKAPGDSLSVTVERNGAEVALDATLGANPDAADRAFLGVLIHPPFSAEMPRGEGRLLPPDGFNFDEMERVTGAAVLEVVPDSAADVAGLLVGDVIQAVDGTQLKSFDELAAAVRALSPGDTLTLTVWRDGAAVDVVVTLGARADDVTAPYLGVRIGPFFQLDQPAEEDDGFRFRSPFGDGSFSPRDFFDRFREMFPNAENDPNA